MKKGDFLEATRAIRMANAEGLKVGQLVRCEQGGKNPRFSALMKVDGGSNIPEQVAFSIPVRALAEMKPAQPIPDHPLLEPIKTRIKNFPQMSQETEALDGTIRIPGEKEIHVHNDGHGGMTSVMSYDGGLATNRLEERLNTALTDAGVSLPERGSYENLAEKFVSFRSYSVGLETFVDYVQRSRAHMDELSRKYGFAKDDDLGDAMKGPGSSGSPGPKT